MTEKIHRFCTHTDVFKCENPHEGLALKIVFNNKANRDFLFDKIKQFLQSQNLNDKIIDQLILEKTSGDYQNCVWEQIGLCSDQARIYGSTNIKPLLPDEYDP